MDRFEIEYNNEKLHVNIIREGHLRTYMMTFSSGDLLFIKRGANLPGDYFWTSIKQRDGEIAHDIIKLIDRHLKAAKRAGH